MLAKALLKNVTKAPPNLGYYILENPTPVNTSEDFFGEQVATSNSYSVVSAYNDDGINDGINDVGTAYIFSNSTKALLHTLNHPNPSTGDQFGSAVDICESYTVVGAKYEDEDHFNAGRVYLFNNSDGSLKYSFYPTDVNEFNWGDNDSIAVNEQYTAIGSYNYDGPTYVGVGRVHIFNNATGLLETILDHPVPQDYALFGRKLDLTDNYIVVTTERVDSTPNNSFSAHVFNLSDFSLRWNLYPPVPQLNDYFGWAVAINDSYIAVAATDYDNTFSNAGRIYVYDNSTGNHSYNIEGTVAGQYLGSVMDMSESYIIANGYAPSSIVYIYNATNGDLVRTITSPEPNPANFDGSFGSDVGITDTHFIIGAYEYYDSDVDSEVGRAYLYTDL